jgi:hypothetical protein
VVETYNLQIACLTGPSLVVQYEGIGFGRPTDCCRRNIPSDNFTPASSGLGNVFGKKRDAAFLVRLADESISSVGRKEVQGPIVEERNKLIIARGGRAGGCGRAPYETARQ